MLIMSFALNLTKTVCCIKTVCRIIQFALQNQYNKIGNTLIHDASLEGRMSINYERIGFNIRRCRKNAGMTQRVLAEKVGCTPEHFSHIEKGSRKVQLEMLVVICEHLNVSIEDVLENALTIEIRRRDDNDDLSEDMQNAAFQRMLSGISKEKAAALMSICQSILSLPRL